MVILSKNLKSVLPVPFLHFHFVVCIALPVGLAMVPTQGFYFVFAIFLCCCFVNLNNIILSWKCFWEVLFGNSEVNVDLLPHVDNSAHVGGFLAGYFLGFVLLMRPQYGYVNRKYIPPGYDVKRKSKYKWYQYFSTIIYLGTKNFSKLRTYRAEAEAHAMS